MAQYDSTLFKLEKKGFLLNFERFGVVGAEMMACNSGVGYY